MNKRLEDYAKFNGIPPENFGKVLLAAVDGGEISTIAIDAEVLEALGIQSEDSEHTVIKKIENAIANVRSRAVQNAFNDLGPDDVLTADVVNNIKEELQRFLQEIQ